MKRINALTIAGTDPSGGAGIQADLKTFSALGAYGCSVITALVAQNTRGVQSVYRIEPDFVAAQLDSVFSDVRIDTTKIGMLAETDIVEAVAERLKRYQVQNVVLDTVMLAKSGDPLLSTSAVETLRTKLLPQVALITPNLPARAVRSPPRWRRCARGMKAGPIRCAKRKPGSRRRWQKPILWKWVTVLGRFIIFMHGGNPVYWQETPRLRKQRWNKRIPG